MAATLLAIALLLAPQRPHSDAGWRQAQREHATDPGVLDAVIGADPAPSALDALIAEETRRQLLDAVAALPEDERAVIAALYVEDIGVQALADRLGVSRGPSNAESARRSRGCARRSATWGTREILARGNQDDARHLPVRLCARCRRMRRA